jgi:transketolase
MPLTPPRLDDARRRLLDMHFRARVGHLGGNLSCIDALMLLHHEIMGSDDRFILSKGHSAGALYVALASIGKLTDADLDTFHKDGTRLAGHPPATGIDGIAFATGSLGHGLSLAAGMALAARQTGSARRIFCLTSDGEWQEGSSLEAAIFVTHQRLHNLTILVDHNRLQGFGTTAATASMDPLHERLAGFGFEARVCNGHDLDSMRAALKPGVEKPVLVILQTLKGHGIPGVEDTLASHYLPPTEAQHAAAIEAFGGAR